MIRICRGTIWIALCWFVTTPAFGQMPAQDPAPVAPVPSVAPAPSAAPAPPAGPPSAESAPAPGAGADFSDQLREASERYQRALKSYDDRNFDAALVEFRRAYELAPTFRILYNLGVVSLELRDYASALDYFERYLVDGAGQISAEQRSEVDQKIRDLMKHIGHVTVAVNVAGAEISVDDRVVGSAPLAAPLRLNSGARRISARVAGRLPDSRVIELAGGDSVRVELSLVDTRTELRSTPPPEKRVGRSVPWLPWAGTAVLAGAAVVSGLRALSAQDDYEDKLESPGTTRHELDDADSKAATWSIAADGFAIAALALGGYSLYLTLRPEAPSDRPAASGAQSSHRSAKRRAAVQVGLVNGLATFRSEF